MAMQRFLAASSRRTDPCFEPSVTSTGWRASRGNCDDLASLVKRSPQSGGRSPRGYTSGRPSAVGVSSARRTSRAAPQGTCPGARLGSRAWKRPNARVSFLVHAAASLVTLECNALLRSQERCLEVYCVTRPPERTAWHQTCSHHQGLHLWQPHRNRLTSRASNTC